MKKDKQPYACFTLCVVGIHINVNQQHDLWIFGKKTNYLDEALEEPLVT
jgi:hypothetical protein